MNEERRPNPEALLKAIKQHEKESKQGSLKIFLGMAAGVGKTYAMLQDAKSLQINGQEVLIGTISTHGRKETEDLLEGLEILPPKQIVYRGLSFSEVDIDEILRRKPPLVLIDELAHSNIPGARHSKRWQDVMEILNNGIDVYTALNVQHIESLKDIIEHITGVTIRETVPDSIIEAADSIELVDLTPGELLKRLKEGKVYLGDKSELAARNFFQADRLTALREIVLRYAAEKIDHDLQEMVSTTERTSGWKTRERLLVAISHHAHAQKIIRIAKRFSSTLNAPWIGLHVNTGKELTDADRAMLAKNLAIAHELGAEVITTNDPSIIQGIKEVANHRGITQIIIGRSPRSGFFEWFQETSTVNRLIRECPALDIHVVRREEIGKKSLFSWPLFPRVSSLYSYVVVFLLVTFLAIVNRILMPLWGYEVAGVVFLIGVLFLSLFFKKGPVFFASFLSALTWAYFFVLPASADSIRNEDSALLTLFLITSLTTGILVDRARLQKETLAKREISAQALYDIVRELVTARSLPIACQNVQQLLSKLFPGDFQILIKEISNGLHFSTPEQTVLLMDEKEKSAALWVFENGRPAGRSTDTLPSAQNFYLPLKGLNETTGVLVYHPGSKQQLEVEETNFLYTVARQLALYIERLFADERALHVDQLKQLDQMQRTFLTRIARLLTEPLSSIEGALSNLRQQLYPLATTEAVSSTALHQELIDALHVIENSSKELGKTLATITAMTQFSEGLLPLNKSMGNIHDVLNECCENFKKAATHIIDLQVDGSLPPAYFDFYLLEVLFLNLLNFVRDHTSKGSTIAIAATKSNDYFIITIASQGPAIPAKDLRAIFEPLYQPIDPTLNAIAPELAICKTIAEIHDGYLSVENIPPDMTKFSVFLPLEG